MALDQGGGMNRPKPPKPQVSYGAPSGPYAAPIGNPSPQSVALGQKLAAMKQPYVQQGTSGYGWSNRWGNVPTAPAGGVVANFLYGFGQSANPANIPKIPGGLKFAAQHPGDALHQMFMTPEGLGGLMAAAIPAGGATGSIGRLGKAEAPAIARVSSYPTGEVTNPGLLSRMGEHADIAEGIIANKMFDKDMAAAKRAEMLAHYSLGDLLAGKEPPIIPMVDRRRTPRETGGVSNPMTYRLGNKTGLDGLLALMKHNRDTGEGPIRGLWGL